MKKVLSILKTIYVEAFIILIYIFVINNFIGNVENNIGSADGNGYYDYLPSTFIHHDLNRKDISLQDTVYHGRVNDIVGYIDYQDSKLNKYPCGTAIMQLPFFGYAYATTQLEGTAEDGYQKPFQKAIFAAALFYLFLALFFLKKTLEVYELKRSIIIFIQILLVFGTAITHYTNVEASFSHVYSLFAVSAFIYFSVQYFKRLELKQFIYACIFLGLIILLRQINVLVILALPFLAGSWLNFKNGFQLLFRKSKWLISGILIVGAIACIQCVFWYYQTGNFILYSYQSEDFDFSSPEIFNILFSYSKGLFVYTPLLFISLSGIVWMLIKRRYYLALSWISFFVILTYIFSSWWIWNYGTGYGMRVYIEYYPLFLIPFALLLTEMTLRMQLITAAITFLTIPLNVIQSYQHKSYILHWNQMDQEKYWQVFLKTDERYEGFLWKANSNPDNYKVLKEIKLGSIECLKNSNKSSFIINATDIPSFEEVTSVEVFIDNYFNENDNAQIVLHIKNDAQDDEENFQYERFLIHYSERELNKWQTGRYNYEHPDLQINADDVVSLEVKSKNLNCELKNVKVRFLHKIK